MIQKKRLQKLTKGPNFQKINLNWLSKAEMSTNLNLWCLPTLRMHFQIFFHILQNFTFCIKSEVFQISGEITSDRNKYFEDNQIMERR